MEPSPFHLSPITGSHTVTEKKNLVLEMGPYFYLSTKTYLPSIHTKCCIVHIKIKCIKKKEKENPGQRT